MKEKINKIVNDIKEGNISFDLAKEQLFDLYSVMHPLPTKEEAEMELSTMLIEIERNTKESYLKRTILKGIEIGFKKGFNYMKGNCA